MYNPTIFGVMGAKTVSKIENGTFDVVGALRASNIVGFLPLLSAFLENSPNRDIALSKSK